MNDKQKNSVPNIWTAQENLIHFYRVVMCGIAILAIFLLALTVVAWFRDPIVVTRSGKSQEFYPSHRMAAAIEKSDVESFTKDFLQALYVWSDFDAESLAKELAPYTDSALITKVVDAQSSKIAKELKGKKLEQAITFVKVRVLDDRVVCNFDRVLKIAGIPLVIPTETTLTMIQDRPTRLNPMGIYVSGILENEGAK